MWNLDEKGFKLGLVNRAEATALTGRRPLTMAPTNPFLRLTVMEQD